MGFTALKSHLGLEPHKLLLLNRYIPREVYRMYFTILKERKETSGQLSTSTLKSFIKCCLLGYMVGQYRILFHPKIWSLGEFSGFFVEKQKFCSCCRHLDWFCLGCSGLAFCLGRNTSQSPKLSQQNIKHVSPVPGV